jgi:hypothetical protein
LLPAIEIKDQRRTNGVQQNKSVGGAVNGKKIMTALP